MRIVQIADQGTTNSYQAITAMEQYKNKSFEELRWEDYKRLKGGGFGGPLTTTSTTSTTTTSPSLLST
jgi:hypothetical protein